MINAAHEQGVLHRPGGELPTGDGLRRRRRRDVRGRLLGQHGRDNLRAMRARMRAIRPSNLGRSSGRRRDTAPDALVSGRGSTGLVKPGAPQQIASQPPPSVPPVTPPSTTSAGRAELHQHVEPDGTAAHLPAGAGRDTGPAEAAEQVVDNHLVHPLCPCREHDSHLGSPSDTRTRRSPTGRSSPPTTRATRSHGRA